VAGFALTGSTAGESDVGDLRPILALAGAAAAPADTAESETVFRLLAIAVSASP